MMGTITSHYRLIILGIIFPLSHISRIERNHEWIMKSNHYKKNEITCDENGLAANPTANYLKSWKGQNPSSSRGHHLFRNAHGILNMIGWGGMLPVGVIIARNLRKNPLKCEEWYNLHVVFQTSGYIIGAIGWGFGLCLPTSSSSHNHQSVNGHRILGIIIFTFATLQIVAAIWLQPKREEEYRRWWWEKCHQLMGYALIVMVIANVFEGIQNQPHQHMWKWIYVGLLVILGLFALSFEIFRLLVNLRVHTQINSYNPTPTPTPS